MGHTIKRCPTANAAEDAPQNDSLSFNAPVNDEWNDNGRTQQESALADEGEYNAGSATGW